MVLQCRHNGKYVQVRKSSSNVCKQACWQSWSQQLLLQQLWRHPSQQQQLLLLLRSTAAVKSSDTPSAARSSVILLPLLLLLLLLLQTKGLMEQFLVDRMVNFMKEQKQQQQPFLVYYAPYAVHGM
jgi:hypothetical protein